MERVPALSSLKEVCEDSGDNAVWSVERVLRGQVVGTFSLPMVSRPWRTREAELVPFTKTEVSV